MELRKYIRSSYTGLGETRFAIGVLGGKVESREMKSRSYFR